MARFGGEEFAVVLPNTDYAGAIKVADRIRNAILGLSVPHPNSAFEFLTVSIGGIAACNFEKNFLRLINCADKLLYQAKNNGKNKSKIFGCSQL